MISALIFQSKLRIHAHHGKIKRVRQSQICASEVITLLLWFHLTGAETTNILSLLGKTISFWLFSKPG